MANTCYMGVELSNLNDFSKVLSYMSDNEDRFEDVDYVLRAINVGKGQHKVVLTFKPKSVEITEGIAYCAYVVLFIAMLFIAYNEYKKRKILKDGNKE